MFFCFIYYVYIYIYCIYVSHDLLHEYRSVLFVIVLSVDPSLTLNVFWAGVLKRCCEYRRYWLKDILDVDLRCSFLPVLQTAVNGIELSSQSWKLSYRILSGLSDCTGWKLKVQCRSTRAQCHSRMSVQWITEQRSIKSASETQHTCGSCNVTTPSMCKEQWALCGNLNWIYCA